MTTMYRFDPSSLKYLGFVEILAGCALADTSQYTDKEPEDPANLLGYTWDATSKTWAATTSTAG